MKAWSWASFCMATLVWSLPAQASRLDSMSVVSGIAQYLLTVPDAGPRGRVPTAFVIDTSRGGWNAMLARQLGRLQTPLLLSLPDSEAYFALHLSIGPVDITGDTLVAGATWHQCHAERYTARGYDLTGVSESFAMVRTNGQWQPAPGVVRGNLLIGHGWCPPFHATRTRQHALALGGRAARMYLPYEPGRRRSAGRQCTPQYSQTDICL